MDKLLFTGGTGFLGNNIMPILSNDYEVTTIGITSKDMIQSNLAKEVPSLPEHYDVVLHACGKAHSVPKTEAEKQAFFDVNYQGTVNLCTALEKAGVPKSFVFISTLSVYGTSVGVGIEETHPLDGMSPYAKSKIMAEEYLQKWAKKNDVLLSILRPSLMTGPNAPGNLGAMVNGIKKGRYFNVAHGNARKSLLMVYDIANVLPKLVDKGGVYNICDDSQPSYAELSKLMCEQLGKKPPLSIPMWLAKPLAWIGDIIPNFPINTYRLKKLTQTCTYSNERIKRSLDWQPMNVLDNYKI